MPRIPVRRTLSLLLATVALTGAAGKDCGGNEVTPDNGRYQFATYGGAKFKYGVHYIARHGGAGCYWAIETEPKAGLKKGEHPHTVVAGAYGSARIFLPEEPDHVNTYLRTNDKCGRWEVK